MTKILSLLLIVAFALCVWTSTSLATGIYVFNGGNAGAPAPSITSYPLTATGNALPLTTITGTNTGWSTTGAGVSGMCLDAAGTHLWTTDQTSNTLSRFNITDNGNVAPGVTVSGASTTLSRPSSCFFNSAGDMWVTNLNNSNVLRFSAAQLVAGGNVAPATTFTATDMSLPQANWVDGSGNIYVGQFGSSACTSANCFAYLFPSTSTGTQTPTAKWTAFQSSSHVNGMALAAGKLFLGLPSYTPCTATGSQAAGIYSYNNPSTSSAAAPDNQLCGSTAFPSSNFGTTMAADANGAVVMPLANAAGDVRIFYKGRVGNVLPDQDIVGASTGLVFPISVVVIGTFPIPGASGMLAPFP